MYALCVTGSYLTHVYKIPYPQKLFQLWLGGSLCVSMCMCEICHHNVFNQRADVSMTDSWSESKNKVVVSVSNSFSDFFFPSSYKVTYPTVTICFSADKVGKDSTTAACWQKKNTTHVLSCIYISMNIFSSIILRRADEGNGHKN